MYTILIRIQMCTIIRDVRICVTPPGALVCRIGLATSEAECISHSIRLENDDVKLVLEQSLSTSDQDLARESYNTNCMTPWTRHCQIKKENFSFRVRTFVFLWVLNSWTDIRTATPDPGPERSTETQLDRISSAGMHHGRDMAGLFVKQKVGDTMRIIGILTVLASASRLRQKMQLHWRETVEPSPP